MNVFDMTKEDFERVPRRGGWSRDIGEFNSLVIIPLDYAHDKCKEGRKRWLQQPAEED